MKKKPILFCAPLIILLHSCNDSQQPVKPHETTQLPSAGTFIPPAAGTIVAADSMPFSEDRLNNYHFAVKLRVSAGNTGNENAAMVYDVLAGYGPAHAESSIAMPRGGRSLQPLLRRDESEKYSYIIGFIPGALHGGDTSFRPYYRVSAQRGEISIKALKGYVFE